MGLTISLEDLHFLVDIEQYIMYMVHGCTLEIVGQTEMNLTRYNLGVKSLILHVLNSCDLNLEVLE